MDSNITDKKHDSNNTVKRYSRCELFKLARSMNDDSITKQLERFENADWTQYQLDLLEEDTSEYGDFRSLPNYDINNSGLAKQDNNSSAGHANNMCDSKMAARDRKNRLARLYSERLSNQVRDKYSSLIETMSNAGANQISGGQVRKKTVSRTSSHNSWLSNEQRRPIERPAYLFGPLRRENGLRNSEEPMSMPCSVNMSARDHQITNNVKWLPNSVDLSLVMDETPIKRITASDKPANEQFRFRHTEDEDDDFDITNLVNITVLSDIKTISTSLQTSGAKSCNLTKPVHRGGTNLPHLAARMPVRSKTALEINYKNRKADECTSQRRIDRRDYHQNTNYYSINNGPEALAYNWQCFRQPYYNLSRAAELPRQSSNLVPSSVSKQKKAHDESVAQIIATFKAQVKARAEAPHQETVKPPAPPPAPPERSSLKEGARVNDKGVGSKQTGSSNVNTHTSVEKMPGNKSDENERPRDTTSTVNDPRDPVGKSAGVGEHKTEGMGKFGTNPRTDDVKQIKRLTSVARVSNIPHLISLHRPKSSLNRQSSAPVANDGDSGSRILADSNESASARASSSKTTSSKIVPSAKKFVSQYKELRGKSLADEVDEVDEITKPK